MSHLSNQHFTCYDSHVHLSVAFLEAVTELRQKYTTALTSATIVNGLLPTPSWSWSEGTKDAQDRDSRMLVLI